MISTVSSLIQGRQQVNSKIIKEVFINSLKANQWHDLFMSYESYMSSKNKDNW